MQKIIGYCGEAAVATFAPVDYPSGYYETDARKFFRFAGIVVNNRVLELARKPLGVSLGLTTDGGVLRLVESRGRPVIELCTQKPRPVGTPVRLVKYTWGLVHHLEMTLAGDAILHSRRRKGPRCIETDTPLSVVTRMLDHRGFVCVGVAP